MKRFYLWLIMSFMGCLSAQAQFGSQNVVVGQKIPLLESDQAICVDLDGDDKLDVVVDRGELLVCYQNLDDMQFDLGRVLADEVIGDFKFYDLDLDDDLDLITSSEQGIVWLANIGDGNYENPVLIADINVHKSISIADLDSDGDADLVVGGGSEVGWIEYLGDLEFAVYEVISAEHLVVKDVSVGDFSGNDHLDIIVGSIQLLSLYENLDGTSFSEQQPVIEGSTPTALSTCDINDDELTDLLVIGVGGDVALLENFDNGTFEMIELEETEEPQFWGVEAMAIDIDNDNDLDILNETQYHHQDGLFWVHQNKIVLYENLQNGEFAQASVVVENAEIEQSLGLACGDLDNDGVLEILFPTARNRMACLYQDENLFNPQRVIPNCAHLAQDVKLADLDGDGDLDAVACSAQSDMVNWFENEGGEYSVISHTVSDEVNFPFAIACDDIDGDGLVDVAIGWIGPFGWSRNLGSGVFAPVDTLVFDNVNAKEIRLPDLDADMDLDIVFVKYGELVMLENFGDGSFGPEFTLANTIGIEDVVACDFDGDADLDLVYSSSSEYGIYWVENLGDLSFAAPVMLAAADGYPGPTELIVEDLNGNGHLDVAVAWSWTGAPRGVHWIENLGDDQLEDLALLVAIPYGGFEDMCSADFDQDGDFDIGMLGNELYWLENQSDGNFVQSPVISDEILGARKIVCGDLDGDLDIDLMTCSKFDDKVAWYENLLGQGGCLDEQACNFTTAALYDDGSCFFAPCLNLGDSNDDGVIDIIDLLDLLGGLGCNEPDCFGDLDGDGVVTVLDLLIFLGWFGQTYP